MTVHDELIDSAEVSKILGVHPQWAAQNRHARGPGFIPFIRVGRLCKYRRSEIEAFLNARTVTSTSDSTGAAA